MEIKEARENYAILQGRLDEIAMRIKLFEGQKIQKLRDLDNLEKELTEILDDIRQIEERIHYYEFTKI